MLRSTLAVIALVATVVLTWAVPSAHARSSIPAASLPAAVMMAAAAPAHDASPCCPLHISLCCSAGACSFVGWLAVVDDAVMFPAPPAKLTYDLSEGSRPDQAGVAPDLPPPRAIV